MSGGKSIHLLVVLGMVLLVIIAGVVVVIGISLAVHGGGMDEVIEMAEKAMWGIVGLVGCIVLIFVAGSIANVCGDAVDRWRGRRPPDEEKNGEATSSGRYGEGPHAARGDQLHTASEETRVRKFIWKVVPPREVRLTIKAARNFLDNNSGASIGILNSEVSSLAKEDANRTIHVVRTGVMSPDHVALALVTLSINRHLGSGMHHIYRGALNMVGMDMLKVWRSAKKEIVERGYASKKDMETANSILMEDIKNVG